MLRIVLATILRAWVLSSVFSSASLQQFPVGACGDGFGDSDIINALADVASL